jgi:hypothetical protein
MTVCAAASLPAMAALMLEPPETVIVINHPHYQEDAN